MTQTMYNRLDTIHSLKEIDIFFYVLFFSILSIYVDSSSYFKIRNRQGIKCQGNV